MGRGRLIPDDEVAEIVELAKEVGINEAAIRLGKPYSTVYSMYRRVEEAKGGYVRKKSPDYTEEEIAVLCKYAAAVMAKKMTYREVAEIVTVVHGYTRSGKGVNDKMYSLGLIERGHRRPNHRKPLATRDEWDALQKDEDEFFDDWNEIHPKVEQFFTGFETAIEWECQPQRRNYVRAAA